MEYVNIKIPQTGVCPIGLFAFHVYTVPMVRTMTIVRHSLVPILHQHYVSVAYSVVCVVWCGAGGVIGTGSTIQYRHKAIPIQYKHVSITLLVIL